MMHDTERHRGGKGELISKLKNIMEDLLTADGAMNFVLQHNETIHGVSQRANEDWQAKVDEMIENQIDDIIIEELK